MRTIVPGLWLEATQDETGTHVTFLAEGRGEVLKFQLDVEAERPNNDEPLPENCFFMKWWGENYRASLLASSSGWLRARPDLGWGENDESEVAPVYELLEQRLTPEETKEMIQTTTSLEAMNYHPKDVQ